MAQKTIKLICCECENEFERSYAEYKRQVNKGRKDFYCGLKCCNKALNRQRKYPTITKICPICGNSFTTTIKKRQNATFCSRSCASKGSVNDARRLAGKIASQNNFIKGDIYRIASILKNREDWRYADIKQFLEQHNEPYEFESILQNYIYDLYLPNRNIYIEFDEPYHKYIDETDKNATVELANCILYRIPIKSGTIIDHSLIADYIK